MARSKVYNLRLSEEEWRRLEAYAKSREITSAEVLRDYIKRLPKSDGI